MEWIGLTAASVASLVRCFSADVQEHELERLGFLGPWVRDDEVLFVHRETGAVCADPSSDKLDVVEYWTSRIFPSESDEDYDAHLPFAQGRLFYVFRTIVDHFRLSSADDISIADFAAGQGLFLDFLRSFSPSLKLFGTEHSPRLGSELRERGLAVETSAIYRGMDTKFQADIATLNWTLSCCERPYDVVMGVRAHLPDAGYLVVAESSRVLVPYRKSLRDLLGHTHPTHVHPWYFSAKSLCALLAAAGFRIEWVNRFFDSDVLLVIARKGDIPPKDTSFETDAANDVVNFFREYARIDGYFQYLAEIQKGVRLNR